MEWAFLGMVPWLALHFPSHPKTAQPSKNPEAGIGHRECLAPAWVTRLWILKHILKGMAAGQGRAPAVSHESEEKPRAPGESQGSGKETPPECPGLATCFPRDSSQGFGFTPALFVSPEQFLGAGLISYGNKVLQASLRVG